MKEPEKQPENTDGFEPSSTLVGWATALIGGLVILLFLSFLPRVPHTPLLTILLTAVNSVEPPAA